MRSLLFRTAPTLAMLVAAITSGCSRTDGKKSADGKAQVTTVPVAAAAPTPLEEFPNPLYRAWADFPVGTTVTIRDVHQHGDNRTVSTKTLKLTELTPELAVVEEQITTVYPDGRKEENPPMRHEHHRVARVPQGTDPKSIGRGGKPLEEGEETLKTPLGEIPTQWYTLKGRVEAGDILHKIWTSSAVPGGTVRVESRVPALNSLTVLEVTEVVKPSTKQPSSP